MRLIKNRNELTHNVLTLEDYRESASPEFRSRFKSLLANGFCYIAYGTKKQDVYFGPSRFVGYRNNTIQKHLNNLDKDGKDTNIAIENILGVKFTTSDLMENRFKIFCKLHGIEPANRERRYIGVGALSLSEFDYLQNDIAVLNTNKKLKETQRQQLINARKGQGDFRKALLGYWHNCPITGCGETALLKASHIKPWRDSNNSERLDPYNGILLSPNMDLAFDAGLISFTEEGKICISSILSDKDAKSLGITKKIQICLKKRHLRYMAYHLSKCFKN